MAIDSVQHLGVEFGNRFVSRALNTSTEAQALYRELVADGLQPQPERTHMFSVFSPDSLRAVAISITPFTTQDLTREAGLSVSEGGHAQAVIVEITNRTDITAFTHLAISGGNVVRSRHNISELTEGRPDSAIADDHIRTRAERAGLVKVDRPLVEIEARHVRSLASISYNALLGDTFSRNVHVESEIAALRGNTSVVSEIALFVLFRTSGSSCCSCSCSCWGSSSCSSSNV